MNFEKKISQRLIQSKEGQIHDVQWNPNNKDFILIAGTMPPDISLYNRDGILEFQFGNCNRNTVIFSPHGRFICIAGFGSLTGDIDIWDYNKKKRICNTFKSEYSSQAKWSADSRFLLTSVTRPRMNMDNNWKIYRYNGELVYEHPIDPLYYINWKPTEPNIYPNRPQSPIKRDNNNNTTATTDTTTTSSIPPASSVAEPKKAYIPPHLRGKIKEKYIISDSEKNPPKKVEVIKNTVYFIYYYYRFLDVIL